MKRAALGVRMHSGWGVLVGVSGDANSVEVQVRRHIVTMNPTIAGAKQPYHHAASLTLQNGLQDAEKYLDDCAAASVSLAMMAVSDVVRELKERKFRISGCAVLLAAGRPLPPLAKILASHPLIHAAEGEFFRNAVSKACERLEIPVAAMRERDLAEQARAKFGNAANRLQEAISSLGKSIGPPWTKDHKAAALAALLVLKRPDHPQNL